MIKKRIRLIWAMVCIVALLFSLTACGKGASTSSSNNQKVTISFLHKWSSADYAPYFKQVVSDFEKKYPNITVKMSVSSDELIKDKLRLMAGNGNLPDVTFSWTGDFLYKFIRAGYLKDLTSYCDDTTWKNSILSSALQPYNVNGKLYGVPIKLDTKFFLYNKSLFQKYNLTVPKTWTQFLNVCQTFKNNNITSIELGNQLPWAGIHYLTSLNGRLVSGNTLKTDYSIASGSFTDSGYVTALNYFKELNDKGYFNKGVNSTSYDIGNTIFDAGKCAMVYGDTEEFKTHSDTIKSSFDWGLFPFPTIVGAAGEQSYLTGAPDGFVVSAKTQHPKECEKFLKFLTNKEEQTKLVTTLGWTPVVKGAMTEQNVPCKQAYEALVYIENSKGYDQWLDTELHANIASVYLNESQSLLNGSVTSSKIMQDVQKAAAQAKTEASK